MKTAAIPGHSKVVSLTATALFLLLGACTSESSEALRPSPLPTAGTVAIVTAPRLAARARVPEKEDGFVSAEIVHEGELVIEHDGDLPPFTVGDVLGGTQDGGYLVRVIGARSLDSTHFALTTVPAALPELLAEGEFHIHYDAADYTRRLDEVLAQPRDPGDPEGEKIATRAQALKLSVGAPIKVLDLLHAGLPASCGVGSDGVLDLDATAELTPVLDIDVKIGAHGGLNPLPELQRFRVVASGRLDVSARVHGTGTVEGGCSIDLLALTGGAVAIPLPTLTFWVGPAPVIVSTDVVPRATASLDLSFTAAEVTAEAHTTTALDVGVDYDDHTWSTIWDPRCKATGTASIQAPGALTASCEISAGAELRARLYGVLGPNLGIEAYARATAETEAPYCTYEAAIDGGVRAYAQVEAGVSVGPLNLSLARLDLVDLDLVHFEGPRFSGPLGDAPECRDEP
jgi:hypothetical protein